MFSRTTARRPLVGAIFAVLLALSLGVGTVFADTVLSQTGVVGVNHLRDTSSTPGVRCRYYAESPPQGLGAIKILAPKVFARDVTKAEDSQQVGWNFRIISIDSHGTKSLLYTSPIVKMTARDDHPANFSIGVYAPGSFARDLSYAVQATMYWYRNGAVEGTSRHRFDHYVAKIDPGAGTPEVNCAGEVTL